MKAKKCKVVVSTASGYICSPIECKSISEAIQVGRNSAGFTYCILDEKDKLIKRGFCLL